MDQLIGTIRDALVAIRIPRLYETERGYQGQLVAELSARLPALELEGAIVEQEYQKNIRDHGFRIRPDIIIHVPFENSDLAQRADGNFVVCELKLRASRDQAHEDYANLLQMCDRLGYPLAIFINIDSNETYLEDFGNRTESILHGFAVRLQGQKVILHECSSTEPKHGSGASGR